jgi:hypothetical protein
MKTLSPLFILSFLLWAAASASAQSAPEPNDKPNVFLQNQKEPKPDKSRLRDLKGIVNDEKGQPLDGAIVQLKDLRSGKIVDFRTQENGRYLFYDLNMDLDYELRVIKDGFESSAMKKLTKYDTRKPATLDFELQHKKAS